MNKMQVVAVRDRAIDAYMQPWFVVSIGQAIRAFADEINRRATDNPLSAHPEDYDLYHLGEFDQERGVFKTEEGPRQVAVGKEQVRP